MMLWFDRHRRLRDRLSAYIDGELNAPAAERLERHLEECGRCRAELLQLRATIAALQELPLVEPPRPFVLSPEQVAARRPPLPAASPLAFGARIAAVGVAGALAVVLVVDLGDIGGNGEVQEAAAPQTTMERLADEDGMEAAAGAPATDEAEGVGAEEPEEGEPPAATAFPSIEELERAITEELERPDKGGGVDALTVAEIGLATALAVLVAGSLALAFAGRRRR